MNAKQTQILQTITNKNWIEWKTGEYIPGNLSYEICEIGDTVCLMASNLDAKEWFERLVNVCINVGPRGGITKVKVC